MIILITGAGHTGKTILAQRLLEKYKYPYLSIDHLKMGLIRSNNTNLTPEDDDALKNYIWPIVREIIKTAIENHQNLIMEGCYIPFDWRKDFDKQYLKFINFICLAMSSNYIETHFSEIKAHSSDIEHRLDDGDCTIQSVKKDNQVYINGFKECGEQVTIIDTDYETTINLLLKAGYRDIDESDCVKTEQDYILIEKVELREEHQKFIEYEFEKYEAENGVSCNFVPFAFSATENNEIIGMITGYTCYSEVYIDELIVKENKRNKGIGTQLVKIVEDYYKDFGFLNINLCTNGFQATNFYKKLGFKL